MTPRLRPGVIITLVIVAVLAVVALKWANMHPTVEPVDILIEAELKAPGEASEPLPPESDKWTLEITLKSIMDEDEVVPLSGDGYDFYVTPYIEGLTPVAWDFLEGWEDDSPLGGKGFTFGSEEEHVSLAHRAINARGFEVSMEELAKIPAFTISPDVKLPVTIRYTLEGTGPSAENPPGFVVYTHTEKRAGKGLSWSHPFRIQMAD